MPTISNVPALPAAAAVAAVASRARAARGADRRREDDERVAEEDMLLGWESRLGVVLLPSKVGRASGVSQMGREEKSETEETEKAEST